MRPVARPMSRISAKTAASSLREGSVCSATALFSVPSPTVSITVLVKVGADVDILKLHFAIHTRIILRQVKTFFL